jgi:hypothetical protein
MRLLLLALMIALLPLRGWVGDAMATEMAFSQSFATKNVAGDEDATRATGHFHVNSGVPHTECHGHTGAAGDVRAEASAPQDHAAHGQCTSCSACQICHTVALTAATANTADVSLPHQLRPAGGIQFASAVSAPYLKPPIS